MAKKTLDASHPKIAQQWHPEKNGDLKASDFTKGSNQKVWWKCPKGDDHEWEAIISDRTRRGSGCHCCAGKKICKDNRFDLNYPKIAKQWHPTKNGTLKPSEFTVGSGKKVWWKCPKGDDHEWEVTISNRVQGPTCPFCRGRKLCKDNRLDLNYPDIAKQWHNKKNGDLKPSQVLYGTKKQVWWKCPKEDDHEWEAKISDRTKLGNGCPCCAGRKLSKSNRLDLNYPQLADQWHPTKNGNLKPSEVVCGSDRKVWWKCPKGDHHEWQAQITARAKQGHGCPKCTKKSSQSEIRILSEMMFLFEDVKSRFTLKRNEIDIFIQDLNLGIEYDGSHFHKNKTKKDLRKNDFFDSVGIKLIRAREKPLKIISSNDVAVSRQDISKEDLNNLVQKIIDITNVDKTKRLKSYIACKKFQNDKVFRKYLSFFPDPFPEHSLETNPDLSQEWNYEKNFPLEPKNFHAQSNSIVWWKCPKGDDHEWEARISSRADGHGCPCCAGIKACKDNRLDLINPEIAKQWHPSKNGDLKPSDFPSGATKKVWWKCSKGDDHEWEATINNRTRFKNGCPCCIGRKASKDNRLDLLHPKVAKEWHPTKNRDLKPSDFPSGSAKKVWWKCPKGDDHEWEASITERTGPRKTGCPCCAGHKDCKDNRLDLVYPKIAKEWHPTKNVDLKPSDFPSGSGKKVWWKCPKGDDHEWEASIINRTTESGRKSGCPCCAGKKICKDNRFDLNYPKIAKQWHPTKNGTLKPSEFTVGSGKKVWWKCPKGDDHEWEAMIVNRTKGRGCPCCTGRKTSKDNRLDIHHPEIATQWHPTKNGKLKPSDVASKSNKKVWWKCPEGEDHEWEAIICNRTKWKLCPFCKKK